MNESMDEGTTGLREFRERFCHCFLRRADALFELCDAIPTAGSVPAPVHLSVASAYRRGWCSLYAASARGALKRRRCANCLRADPPAVLPKGTSPFTPSTPVPGCAATPSAAPREVTITTQAIIPPANPSWPAEPTSSSPG